MASRDTAPAVIPPAVAAALVDVAPTIALALETLALVDDNHGPAVDTAMEWLITAAGGRFVAHGASYSLVASYCGDCDETYTAGAVAKRCARHESERTARIAAWRAAGGSGGHYDDTDTDTEGSETR